MCVTIVLLCQDQFFGWANGYNLVTEVKHAGSLSDEALYFFQYLKTEELIVWFDFVPK